MTVNTKNTFFVLVTCSVERTRARVLETVVKNILDCEFPMDDFMVVDNGSTIDDTRQLLKSSFKHVHFLKSNFGYWSAILYALENMHALGRHYEYVYVIESDEIHYAAHLLEDCENFLNEHLKFGTVYTQEFSVQNVHLYDKTNRIVGSRTWAWKGLKSPVTGKRVIFEAAKSTDKITIYSSDLAPQVCALNRTSFMYNALMNLSKLEIFNESHFWNEYFTVYAKTSLIEGG